MKYQVQIKLQGLPHTTNSLGRKHWTIKAREARNWRVLVGLMIGKHRPTQPLDRAKLTLTRYSSGVCDPDGLVSSFKAIIDGLVDAGIIVNDRPVNIGMPTYLQEKCAPGEGFVTVKVEEI